MHFIFKEGDNSEKADIKEKQESKLLFASSPPCFPSESCLASKVDKAGLWMRGMSFH